jgi:hypothetical protein
LLFLMYQRLQKVRDYIPDEGWVREYSLDYLLD